MRLQTALRAAESQGFARGVEAAAKVVDSRLLFYGMRHLTEGVVERLRALVPVSKAEEQEPNES